jgi:hypothetical protein
VTGIDALVRRVRLGLWGEAALRLLNPVLWVSALMVALGALARWRLGIPGAVTLLALAALPVLAALGLALARRPSLAEAALVADRRLGAEALLVTAWHLAQAEAAGSEAMPGARSGTGSGTGRVVLARARQAAQDWALDPRLAPRTPLPWTPMLAALAALPLLGLDPVRVGPGGVGTAGGSGPRPVHAPMSARGPDPSALAQAIAALVPEPGPQAEADLGLPPQRPGGAPGSPQIGPQAVPQSGPAARPSASQGQPPGQVSLGATQVQPDPANPQPAAAGLQPQTSAPLAGGPGTGGREGAGTEAMQRQAGQPEASPAGEPDPGQGEQRVAIPRRPEPGPANAADLPGAPLADQVPDPWGLPQVQTRISAARPPTPAESGPPDPAAFTQGLTPAQRALAARYFVLTQEAP